MLTGEEAGMKNEAVVPPGGGFDPVHTGALALMVATRADAQILKSLLPLTDDHCRPLFNSRLYLIPREAGDMAVVCPVIGAPYAVMVLETLIAWGVRKVLFLGWCGAISPKLSIGDIIIPTAAVIEEGTSRHYRDTNDPAGTRARPAGKMVAQIETILTQNQIPFNTGPIWTTDAIYRETRAKVARYQSQGIVAVEMEMSALFSVGAYRQVDVGGILVVSDELSTLRWKPGFKAKRFQNGRKAACHGVRKICQHL